MNFYFETNDLREAHYVSGILNAPMIDQMMKPMQAKGLWGPRHICKKVLELPIPEFKDANRKHTKLAEIAQACAEKVKAMVPELRKLFEDVRAPHAIGRARTTVRQALKDELAEIDSIVKELVR